MKEIQKYRKNEITNLAMKDINKENMLEEINN